MQTETKKLTGVELIAEERQRQIEVKSYDAEFIKSHPEYYADYQLENAAMFMLSGGDGMYYPERWPDEDVERLMLRSGIEKLKVAGALIAAEIDRLNNQ